MKRLFLPLLLVFGISAALMGYLFAQPLIAEIGVYFQNRKLFDIALLLLSFSTGLSFGILATNILNQQFKVYPIILSSALVTLFILVHIKGVIDTSMYFAVIAGLTFSMISSTPYLNITKPDIILKIALICLFLVMFIQAGLLVRQDFENIDSLINVGLILIISLIGIGLAIKIMDK